METNYQTAGWGRSNSIRFCKKTSENGRSGGERIRQQPKKQWWWVSGGRTEEKRSVVGRRVARFVYLYLSLVRMAGTKTDARYDAFQGPWKTFWIYVVRKSRIVHRSKCLAAIWNLNDNDLWLEMCFDQT